MKCALVVLNYNDFDMTSQFLSYATKCNSIDYLVIVDNCSPDGSYDRLKEFQNSRVIVIKSEYNKGYSYGNNLGIDYVLNNTDADIIGISNPDVIFDDHVIQGIKQDFAISDTYSIITALQHNKYGEVPFNAFWKKRNKINFIFEKAKCLRLYYHLVHPNDQMKYVLSKIDNNQNLIEVGCVEGSFFFIRRDDIKKCGGFDDNVFLYYEEDILVSKLSKYNKKVIVDKDLYYTHLGGKTTQKSISSEFVAKQMYKSSVYLYKNYLSKNILLNAIFDVVCYVVKIEDIVTIRLKKILHKLRRD